MFQSQPLTVTSEMLLLECAQLLNEFGPDSPEVDTFIAEHSGNTEFGELARFSVEVKRALLAEERGNAGPIDQYSPALGRALRNA